MNPEDRELDLPSGIEGKKILVRDALELIKTAKDLGKMEKLREVSFLLDIASDILEELMDKYGISLKEILEILKEDDKEEIAYALVTAGSIHRKRGELDKALEFYKEALKIFKKIGDKRRIAITLNSIGFIHSKRGEYDKALEFFERALEIFEEIGDKVGIDITLNGIESIYRERGKLDKALELYKKALKIREEIDKKRKPTLPPSKEEAEITILADTYERISLKEILEILKVKGNDRKKIAYAFVTAGSIYCKRGEYNKALESFKRALEIFEEIGDKKEIAEALNNIGFIHYERGELDKALEFYKEALKIFKEIGDKEGFATTLNNIGLIHYEKRRIREGS